MNILPLILILLTILTMASLGGMKEHRLFTKQKTLVKSFYETERALWEKKEIKAYENFKVKTKEKTTSPSLKKTKAQKPYKSPRTTLKLKRTKYNLALLFEDQKTAESLVLKLLEYQYAFVLFQAPVLQKSIALYSSTMKGV